MVDGHYGRGMSQNLAAEAADVSRVLHQEVT